MEQLSIWVVERCVQAERFVADDPGSKLRVLLTGGGFQDTVLIAAVRDIINEQLPTAEICDETYSRTQ